ncbi:MAG: 4a-hydroxytetrahydrobiopterin dehydratase [Bryobacter sp.]
MSREKLSVEQIMAELQSLPGWKLIYGGKLLKLFHFKTFAEAFSLLAAVAIEAEKMNHHPEMRNVYTMDEFILTTHDADGLTELDVALARKIEALAKHALPQPQTES